MKAKREHKTVFQTSSTSFDSEVNMALSEGWEVYSSTYFKEGTSLNYVAFLSREVAESPPIPKTGEDSIDLSELFHNGMMVIGMAAWKEIKAKADAWDTYSPTLPKTTESRERPSNDLLRKALEFGWDTHLTGISKADAPNYFTNWLQSLPPNPLEADRRLLSPYLQYIDWTSPIIAVDGDDSDLNELPERLDASLRRLCGEGESNG